MKEYKKTKWIDKETPVNAANLNKIEDALDDLYKNTVRFDGIKEGDGLQIETNESGDKEINLNSDVMKSVSCTGIEIVSEIPVYFDPDKLYFIIDKEKLTLSRIMLNGKVLFKTISASPIKTYLK